MQKRVPRREFVHHLGMITAVTSLSSIPGYASMDPAVKSPFRIAVINDEITQDFGRACEVASKEFGMEWIELRGMWNKNLLKLDAREIDEARRILEKYQLRVTDIASPLFKVDWPGAPPSKFRPKRDQCNADFTFEQQDEVLERSIELAKTFNTDRVRFFDFWRLEDQAPYRAPMNEKLRDAAEKAAKKNVILVLENEPACNTATAAEAAKVLGAISTPNLMLNWDPGNAAERGEKPYPDGYDLLPKDRIGHCHCKDVAKKRDGYHFAVSLETHWRSAGTPEESTRQSWAGMKKTLQVAGAI